MSEPALNDTRAQYEALGIFPDTWTCITYGAKRDITKLLFDLAASGVPALVSKSPESKLWHVAIKGGLIESPVAYLVMIRGEPLDGIPTCTLSQAGHGQHPQAARDVT